MTLKKPPGSVITKLIPFFSHSFAALTRFDQAGINFRYNLTSRFLMSHQITIPVIHTWAGGREVQCLYARKIATIFLSSTQTES